QLTKLRRICVQASSELPKVRHEPETAGCFTNVGASTLEHELGLYVREVRDRRHTVDELNRAIDRLCRANDINIAFNQLELHLHNAKGAEVTAVKRALTGCAPVPLRIYKSVGPLPYRSAPPRLCQWLDTSFRPSVRVYV
ncbi:hypothetical protein, partial [Salmonella enterica]|uniref:hypothetical protein n=1 Tax=Salmonella enterica TaxID=28901 RepID=UPI00398C55FF